MECPMLLGFNQDGTSLPLRIPTEQDSEPFLERSCAKWTPHYLLTKIPTISASIR